MIRALSKLPAARSKDNDDEHDDDDLSWDDLVAIERRRRDILRRTELPLYRMLFFWDGTVLQAMATDPLIYFTISIYVAMRVLSRRGLLPEYGGGLGGASIGTIGAFLSFFLVFFVVASNRRFDTLYDTSMSCEGRIFDAAALAKTTLPRANALRLVRYMNATHVTGYVGLSETYTSENFFGHINKSNRLLTTSECQRVQDINMNLGGSAYRELITWCCAEITTAEQQGLINSRLASQFRDIILRLRGSLGKLYDYADQPIFFFYEHFIALLSVFYLPMFAISAGLQAGTGDAAYWFNDIVALLVVVLQCIFVTGLRFLGQRMADPYGSDVQDLSVMHYVNFTWRMSRRMLEAELPGPVDAMTEQELVSESQTIGQAWDEGDGESDISDELTEGETSTTMEDGEEFEFAVERRWSRKVERQFLKNNRTHSRRDATLKQRSWMSC